MNTPSILLVEDHDITSYAVVKLFSRNGYNVDHAEDGEKAIAKLATNQYDLVITDLAMPRVSGQELISTIRSSNKPDVKIMVLTSETNETAMAHTFNLGADDYLCKPFQPANLLNKVERLLKN